MQHTSEAGEDKLKAFVATGAVVVAASAGVMLLVVAAEVVVVGAGGEARVSVGPGLLWC
jgi:hypothetical protein